MEEDELEAARVKTAAERRDHGRKNQLAETFPSEVEAYSAYIFAWRFLILREYVTYECECVS
jgi:hypothetical protein